MADVVRMPGGSLKHPHLDTAERWICDRCVQFGWDRDALDNEQITMLIDYRGLTDVEDHRRATIATDAFMASVRDTVGRPLDIDEVWTCYLDARYTIKNWKPLRAAVEHQLTATPAPVIQLR